MDRKCLELAKTLKDPTISEAACIAFQGFNPPKCKECEWANGAIQPIQVSQDELGSIITPKTGKATSETPETVLGHSRKAKGQILGRCEKRDEELTWSSCSQRRRRNAVKECQGCDQKPFQFFEQPMGSGWHNSAARAGERECPELGGRKIKKGTCLMRAGKKRHKGQSCVSYCQFWEGEKMEKPSATRALITMWCPTCQAERAGWTNQKTYCGECEAELQAKQPTEDAMAYSERRELHKPLAYFCPTPYCAHQVEVEGMLCGDCQIEKLKGVKPSSIYPMLDGPPQHSVETFCRLLKKHPEIYRALAEKAEREIRSLEEQIVWELREAVKEVEGAKSL